MPEYSVRMLSLDNQSLATNLDRAGYRKMGVHVTSSESYSDTIKKLQCNEIDVVVINADFKEIDPFAIIKSLKSSKDWKDLAVIVTSVRNNASLKKRSLEAGADLFVEQPVPRQYFIEKIKGLLEQQTRNTERVELDGGATFEWQGKSYTQSVNDLSVSGMLISSELEIPKDTAITVSFSVPMYKKQLVVHGEVARIVKFDAKNPDRLTGVGVKFISFDGDSQKRLEKYIEATSEKNSKMQYYL